MLANKLASTPRTMRASIVQAKPSIARPEVCVNATTLWGNTKPTTIDKAAAIEEVRLVYVSESTLPLFNLPTSPYHILLPCVHTNLLHIEIRKWKRAGELSWMQKSPL